MCLREDIWDFGKKIRNFCTAKQLIWAYKFSYTLRLGKKTSADNVDVDVNKETSYIYIFLCAKQNKTCTCCLKSKHVSARKNNVILDVLLGYANNNYRNIIIDTY